MNQQEAVKWACAQDVVKVSCIKVGEEDKFILTVGQYNVTPIIFDTQEQAQTFLDVKFKLTNLDLAIIGAMCQKLNELSEQDKLNSKNEEQ
nr:MAG TPA: hypothetical protein [Microviridae sp.]